MAENDADSNWDLPRDPAGRAGGLQTTIIPGCEFRAMKNQYSEVEKIIIPRRIAIMYSELMTIRKSHPPRHGRSH